MPGEIHFNRSDYESRIDLRADDIDSFVSAVLATIDADAAESSSDQWDLVCRYSKGCAQAAKVQGNTPRSGGRRIADHLTHTFPTDADPSSTGFFEFMDWLSNPDAFRPKALLSSLEQLRS